MTRDSGQANVSSGSFPVDQIAECEDPESGTLRTYTLPAQKSLTVPAAIYDGVSAGIVSPAHPRHVLAKNALRRPG